MINNSVKKTVQQSNAIAHRLRALLAAEIFLGSACQAAVVMTAAPPALAHASNGFIPVVSPSLSHASGAQLHHAAPTSWFSHSSGSAIQTTMLPGYQLGSRSSFTLPQLAQTFNISHLTLPRVSNFAAANGTLKSISAGIDLDLASTTANIVLPASIFQNGSAITIEVGGVARAFSSGQTVTAAEYIAIQQVSGGGTQTIKIEKSGAADGGSFNLGSVTSKISELVVPSGVTAIDNFSSGGSLNVSGDILNYGQLYGVSTNNQITAGSIFGKDIINESGGVISTVLPATLAATIGGVVSSVDLNLSASNNISNAGIISSSGALNLVTASGALTNASASHGASATIFAQGNIGLTVAAAGLTNSGSITSSSGNINIAGVAPSTNINVNAAGGTFNAANAININNAAYNGSGNIVLNGGNYNSQALNLYAAQNIITGNLGNVTGTVNTQAQTEHVTSASQDLILGNNNVSGDPTFVNTAGDIVITGANNFAQSVAILASGNVTTMGNGQIVDPGGNVTIIAGALTTTTGSTTNAVPGTAATQNVTVTLDPTKSTGGDINFSSGAAATVIDTSAGSNKGNGGNVTLVALASNGGNGGNVLLGSSNIDTSTSGTGASFETHNGGNVTIIAGATPATAAATVTVGNIDTGGAYNVSGVPQAGGSVAIYTQQPMISTLTFGTQGNLTAGKIENSGKTIGTAGITISGDINTVGLGGYAGFNNTNINVAGVSAGAITLVAGSDITGANLFAYGAGGTGAISSASPTFTPKAGSAGGDGAPITVSSISGDISFSGVVNNSGGGGGGGSGRNQATRKSGTDGGKGGSAANISITTQQGSLTLTGGVLSADGGAGGSGGKGSANEGGGGGGGGSYGGGGGGGGDNLMGGGGGGGGTFGGGGAADGAGGGGSTTGGLASNTGGSNGTANNGGSSNKGSAGGAFGAGGAGAAGAQYAMNGANGASVSTSKSTVTLSSGVDLTTGFIAGGTVKISSGQNGGTGDISLSNGVTAFASASLQSVNGAISESAGAINTPSLTLKSATGAIGSNATPLAIGATTLTATTGSGGGMSGIFLSSSGAVNIEAANAVDGAFQLAATSDITATKSAITAASVALSTTRGDINVLTQTGDIATNSPQGSTTISNTGTLAIDPVGSKALSAYTLNETSSTKQFDTGVITLEGSITSANTLVINTKVERGQPAGIVEATPTAVLTSSSITISNNNHDDIGSSVSPIQTATSKLAITTAGNVYASNVGSVTISNSTAGIGPRSTPSIVFSLSTTPDAGGNGQIIIGAGGITVLRSETPNVTSSVILNSSETGVGKGGIVLASGGGTLKADIVSLTDGMAGAGSAPIGSDTTPIKIDATTVSANTKQNVYLDNKNTGNINVLTSTLATGFTFALITAGSIDTLPGAGNITASTVVLIGSASGSIGISSALPALVSGDNLTLSTGKNLYINDSSANPVSLVSTKVNGITYNNQAKDAFSVVAPNSTSLTNQQAITSGSIFLQAINVTNVNPLTGTDAITMVATGAGNAAVGAPIKAPLITLGADSGTIVQAKGVDVITATKSLSINLTNGGTANLQNAPNDAATLNDNVSGAGQVLFNQAQPITIGTISGTGQTLTIAYTGSLTTTTPFAVNSLSFTPSGASKNDGIKVVGAITTTSTGIFTADGTGDIQSAGLAGTGDKALTASGNGDIKLTGALSGNQVTLSTNGGSITQTATAPVSATAALIINLMNGGTADLSKAIGNFSVFNDAVTGSGKVTIVTSSSLVLNSIAGANQILSATSGDTIVTPNPIAAASLSLTASGAGGIGNVANPVTTGATTLTLVDSAPGANVFAASTNTTGVTLNTSAAGAMFTLTAAGSITTAGALSGNNISLQSGGASGGIAIGDKVGNATSTVTLAATGAGNITTKAATDIISAQTLTITSAGGSIAGATANTALQESAANVTFTTSGSGLVNVNSSTAQPVTLGTSTSGLAFTLTTAGPLTVNSITTNAVTSASTGSINLIDKIGALNVIGGSSISANGGSILLQDSDIKAGSIIIGASTTMHASSKATNVGNVVINLGAKVSMIPGQEPPNVVQNITAPGQIFFGANSITALAPNNTLNATGRNIVFDTDGASGSIQLGGGVTITADPPAGAVAAGTVAAAAVLPVTHASSLDVSDQITAMPSSLGTPAIGSNLSGNGLASTTLSLFTQSVLPIMSSQFNGIAAAIDPTFFSSGGGVVGSIAANMSLAGQASRTELSDLSERPAVASQMIDAELYTDGPLPAKISATAPAVREIHGSLTAGNAVFAPVHNDVAVDTPFGTVKIAAGAVVLVMATGHGLAVFDFDDRKAADVVVHVGDKKLELAPGKHLLVASSNVDRFEDINAAEMIPYAGLTKKAMSDKLSAFSGDFHLPTALCVVNPLRQLVASNVSGRETSKHLLKTMAIMINLTQGGADYKHYRRPLMTACK